MDRKYSDIIMCVHLKIALPAFRRRNWVKRKYKGVGKSQAKSWWKCQMRNEAKSPRGQAYANVIQKQELMVIESRCEL